MSRIINACDAIRVVPYSADQQRRVADEMDAAPGAMWVEFLRDYGVMREAVRACQGQ